MGASASVNAADKDWSVDNIVESLLPFYVQDIQKCVDIHNELMERANLHRVNASTSTGETSEERAEGSPSNFGKEILCALNQARMNPRSFISYAENHLKLFTDDFVHKDKHNRPHVSIKTKEGRAAVMECIEFLRSVDPCGPLELNEHLEKCAADYVQQVCNPTYRQNKAEPIGDRFAKYGCWRGTIGEVVSFGDRRAVDVVLSLLIDDGALSRGNRASVFDPSYTQVGASIINWDSEDGSSCCVIEFAASMRQWSLFERRDVVVSSGHVDSDSGLSGGVIDHELFERVLASIPVDDVEREVERMATEQGAVVTIDFSPSTKSAKIIQTKVTLRAGAKSISTSTMSVSWGPPSASGENETIAAAKKDGHKNSWASDDKTPPHSERIGAPVSESKSAPTAGDLGDDVVPGVDPSEPAPAVGQVSTPSPRAEDKQIELDSNGLWTPDLEPPNHQHKPEDKRLAVVVREGEDGVDVSPKNQILVFDMSGR